MTEHIDLKKTFFVQHFFMKICWNDSDKTTKLKKVDIERLPTIQYK